MNRFLNAMQTNNTRTENNMTTHSTSGNALVDFFGFAGAARKHSAQVKQEYFARAFGENPDYAMKLLFWARDVRGGAGERQLFRDIAAALAIAYPESLYKNVPNIPEYGRWDDLLELFDTELENAALRVISTALKEGNGLCAKWMPRKGPKANTLRAYLQLSPKQYRKMLVKLTNVVETFMCNNEFEAIDYGKLPSLASARYQKAFLRRDPIGYTDYINSLKKGEVKINAGAIYPYDVIKSLKNGNKDVANAQWKVLPDYLEGSENKNILPVVDTSGSMETKVSGKTTAMDISISLGMYLAERNRGAFKDHFITFSSKPALQRLMGDLIFRYYQLRRADWSMNTNIEATFDLILNQALKFNVPQSDMPDQILIISDMQFDQCTGGRTYGWGKYSFNQFNSTNPNALQMIKSKYVAAGYKCPEVIFWNVNARADQSPVKVTDSGVALVSGFSPAIMKHVLAATDLTEINITPYDIMMEVINHPRYANIRA